MDFLLKYSFLYFTLTCILHFFFFLYSIILSCGEKKILKWRDFLGKKSKKVEISIEKDG